MSEITIEKQVIKVKQNPKTKGSYFDLKDFSSIFDVSKIKYYQVQYFGGQSLNILVYDKDKNVILPYINNETKNTKNI